MPKDSDKATVTTFNDASSDLIIFLEDQGDGTYRRKNITADNAFAFSYTSPLKIDADYVWWSISENAWRTDTTAPSAETDGALVAAPLVGQALTDGSMLIGDGSGLAEEAALNTEMETALRAANLLATQQALELEKGVDVQAYDADTAKLDVAQDWSAQQTFEQEVIIEAPNTGEGLEIINTDTSVGRVQLKLLSKNSTATDDFFSFIFRPDLGNVVQTIYDDSTATFYRVLNFSYTDLEMELGSATNPILVGINDVSPSFELDVSGDIQAQGQLITGTFTVSTLPTANAAGIIRVSDETGGDTLAFSDGTNWRRCTDLAIVS